MDIKITPGKLEGELPAVSSKSYAHRALICAALSERETEIYCNLFSKDIEATVNCLNALGAEIEYNKEKGLLSVKPVKREVSENSAAGKFGRAFDAGPELNKGCGTAELCCGESGSTLRFILPVAAALGRRSRITGGGKLPERPVGPLLAELKRHGISFSGDRLPFIMEGELSEGEYELPGDISSQFITGLLLAFPEIKKCGAPTRLKLATKLQSSAYVDMSLEVMRAFGVDIKEEGAGFSLCGKEEREEGYFPRYRSPLIYKTEGDWSNSAMWLCAGELSGNRISVTGLNKNSLQGDRRIVDILEKMRAFRELKLDVSEIPDLVPALSVAAAFHEGKIEIINAGRLRIKECDRLSAIAENLKKLGVNTKERSDSLVIEGKASLKGGVRLSGFNDHRMVMSAALIAAACEEPVIIEGAEAVEKSYPHFFKDFKKTGGKADVV